VIGNVEADRWLVNDEIHTRRDQIIAVVNEQVVHDLAPVHPK
jgi:hypothetical protein